MWFDLCDQHALQPDALRWCIATIQLLYRVDREDGEFIPHIIFKVIRGGEGGKVWQGYGEQYARACSILFCEGLIYEITCRP